VVSAYYHKQCGNQEGRKLNTPIQYMMELSRGRFGNSVGIEDEVFEYYENPQ
jgi:hypothetical protein